MEYTKSKALLASMSLEEKIGQLFVIRPEGLIEHMTTAEIENIYENGCTELTEEMKEAMARYHVGGFTIFAKNILGPEQLLRFTEDLQKASEIPLILSIDEEGGRVARIGCNDLFDVERFEPMSVVGATGDTENAYKVGAGIGKYLQEYNFNLDFAPVADVNSNADNIVIGRRSFGSDPKLVGEMICAALRGFHDVGMTGCIKHFPGHGDTHGDTHLGYVEVPKTWEQARECELIPFKMAIEAGVDVIMTAHITTPNMTKDGLPASLSYEMLTEKLRGELGYDGVIITDALAMGAIAQHYAPAESAVLALKAGVDLLLMPGVLSEAFAGVKAAVESGDISEELLNEHVLRALKLKEKLNLL